MLKPTALADFLDALAADVEVPPDLITLISSLLSSQAGARPSLASVIGVLDAVAADTTASYVRRARPAGDRWIENTVERGCVYLRRVATPERSDRLWPADPQVFTTNPLNVAFGAAGILYALRRMADEPGDWVVQWMRRQPIDANHYPPGLGTGIAGIAWVLLDLGDVEDATRLLSMTRNDARINSSPDMFFGAAGVGLTHLKFFLLTQDARYLDETVRCARMLLETAREDNGALSWQSFDRTYFGFHHGASGVALFFLYLHLATGDATWLDVGRKALDFDLRNGIWLDENRISWPYHTARPSPVLPYLKYGSAGVGTAVLRFLAVTHDPSYVRFLDAIVSDVGNKYAIFPGFLNGRAGLGSMLLDSYRLLGRRGDLDRAHQIAESLRLYAVERGDGTAFPGDGLARISCDFGTGSAGILLFLHRLTHPVPAPFLLDELIAARSVGSLPPALSSSSLFAQ